MLMKHRLGAALINLFNLCARVCAYVRVCASEIFLFFMYFAKKQRLNDASSTYIYNYTYVRSEYLVRALLDAAAALVVNPCCAFRVFQQPVLRLPLRLHR